MTGTPKHVLVRWLSVKTTNVGKHPLLVMAEIDGVRAGVLDDLRELVRTHYVSSETTAKRLAELGAPKTAELFVEHVPTTKTARSGDLGEILATEIAEVALDYEVPIRRLRWKDGRNMALRGDDIVGIRRVSQSRIDFLKGESKSRVGLTAAVIDEAGEALDRARGRPTRHSVLFVAERLRDLGDDALSAQLEDAVLKGFRGSTVEHLLLTLSSGNPTKLLTEHLNAAQGRNRRRHAVGVRIVDHGKFIELLFGGL